MGEWVHHALPCGITIATTIFAQSLSKRRNTIDYVQGVKGQGQLLWHSFYKTLWAGYIKEKRNF